MTCDAPPEFEKKGTSPEQTMHGILFVDDEPNVLNGLRRTLRSMRNEWRIDFANSGEEALNKLAGNPFDVIVSDIRMPGMDGLQLLTSVKERYPNIIRLALSGHAHTEVELECARAAHQFLAKPASIESIKAAINRSTSLQALVKNESIISAIGSIETLPSLPEVYRRIVSELSRPDGNIVKIAEIVSEDVGMSAKILQLVNSAFFGVPRQIDSIRQAVTLLGFEILKSLVLSQQVFKAYDDLERSGLNLSGIIRHCNRTGALARRIAILEDLPSIQCDQALMAGMLHNVGKLILADCYPERYASVCTEVEETGVSDRVAEEAEFGVSHELIGGCLLGVWGLPDNIVEAVSFHHTPNLSLTQGFSVLACVYFAASLIQAGQDGIIKHHTVHDLLDTDYVRGVSTEERLNEWIALADDYETVNTR